MDTSQIFSAEPQQELQNIKYLLKLHPPQKIKYLQIKLTKEVKDLYAENYKTLSRKLKMIQRNGKIFYAPGLEELILLKWLYYPKQSTDLIQSLLNYP